MTKEMNKAFVYGVSVGGNNFTDRIKESHRLKMNFEKSNITKMQKLLLEKDFIERREDGLYLSDPVLQLWLKQYER